MKLNSIAPVLSSLVLFAVACGGGDDSGGAPAAQQGTVNPQAAKGTATATISAATTAVKTNNGMTAAAQMQSAASQAQSIVSPAGGAGTAPSGVPGLPDLGSLSLALGEGCTCEATKCVFKACKDNPSVEMNGEISWDGGHVVCKDLNYKITQGVSTIDMTTNCDLTVTDALIKGTLGSKGSTSYNLQGGQGQTGAGTYTWDSTVKFNDVAFANGQPTGGSIDATSTVTMGAGQSYTGSSNVKFP